jgi:hypothetical protein
MSTDLDGTALTLKVMKRIQNGAPDEFGRAQFEETKVEAVECQRRSPFLSGDLFDSIRAVGYAREGRSVVTAVVAGEAGSGAEEYALQQHEDLEIVHPHGEAKFIERPLNESAPYMMGRIGKRIDINRTLK